MKRNAMRKNLLQCIRKSLGRYIAIVMIIALGASMFVGLLMTKTDMVATGEKFVNELNMFDLRIMNSYGWTQEDVNKIAQMEGVVDAEGILYLDLIVRVGKRTDDSVLRFYSIPEKVNLLELRNGRMPSAADECLIVGYQMDDSIIGTKIKLSDNNKTDDLESMVVSEFTIVGLVATPLYMDMNRGTTSVGNGALENCLYLLPEAFDVDYFAEINITIPGDYTIYSDAYNNAMDAMAEQLEPKLEEMAENRYITVKAEAEEAYFDGLKEYSEGVWAFYEGQKTAEKELADAYQQLLDGEQAIINGEQDLIDGEKQLQSAKAQLAAGQAELDEGRKQYESMRSLAFSGLDATEQLLEESRPEAAEKVAQKEAEIAEVDARINALNGQYSGELEAIAECDRQIFEQETQTALLNTALEAAQHAKYLASMMPGDNQSAIERIEGEIASITSRRDACVARVTELKSQRSDLVAQMEAPNGELAVLQGKKSALKGELAVLQGSLTAIDSALTASKRTRAALEEQFASAEAELAAGEQQIAQGYWQLAQAERQIIEGKAELEQAKIDIAQGWIDYEAGKAEAEAELADAEAELKKAKQELLDAKDLISQMTESSLFILDRNSNAGYTSLNSASDIVQGVSRVLPAFFLLVASLVCITTMTRMIDEERTQIGTLKALGYSNGAIISKYLLYAGSGAIVGCGLGVLVGSAIFPAILWQAYKIMLYITDDIVLKVNWTLCGIVVGAYTLVMLLVTWYCCRRTLAEVPAELIRPKAPDAGKKILLEYLPIWRKISFLNKVTIRNIFRYRQRLAMMMVGIGGCTALLLTGFGLRDSIINVVDYQFQEVTTYDMSVYFSENQTEEEQTDFLKAVSGYTEDAMFYHQSSIELDHNNKVKEIYLIASGEGLQSFIDMHDGEKQLPLPGMNEVVLSVGVAEALGIDIGDEVMMRNADMQILNLKVSGIYDNHVFNYAIVTTDTVASQWGEEPGMQMAFVKVKAGETVHEVSAEISKRLDVMNVSVSEDLADMVGSMMDALDLVVWVVVFCAGLLAAIVLYNLTNINITERIREIATIKVLGFNAGETGAYVFKENLTLTAIGSVFGLGLGYAMLLFVMSQIKIDMVWFKALAQPASYLISIGLTMLSAIIVDFIFYFKLDQINMAEALKSVE